MITIRKAKVEDAEGIALLFREGFKRKTWKYTGSNSFKKARIEKTRERLSSKKPEAIYFVAIDKEKIVGQTSYSFKREGRTRHSCTLGWGIHPDYEGQGIGTRMLKEILKDAKKRGFKRAEAEMAIANIGSWKMALKNGFKIEGTKKKALLLDDGTYADTYIVGKLL